LGLLKNLFGGDKDSTQEQKFSGKEDDIFSPRYKTIRKWIESRIGKIDLNDPNLIPRMKKLHEDEFCNLKEPLDNLVIFHNGNDTIIRDSARKYWRQMQKLGFQWDKKMKVWVAYDQRLSKEDILSRCTKRTTGLEAYIKKVEYRVRLESK
jgi:hypothetical protein